MNTLTEDDIVLGGSQPSAGVFAASASASSTFLTAQHERTGIPGCYVGHALRMSGLAIHCPQRCWFDSNCRHQFPPVPVLAFVEPHSPWTEGNESQESTQTSYPARLFTRTGTPAAGGFDLIKI